VPSAPPEPQEEEAFQEALPSLQPLVHMCFLDVAERYPGSHRVKLRFTHEGVGEGGRLRGGEVVESSIQDPFLHACFLDALEDARVPAPRGGGAIPVTHTFHFRPEADGGT
jgi:hypothetical protein